MTKIERLYSRYWWAMRYHAGSPRRWVREKSLRDRQGTAAMIADLIERGAA